MQPIHKEPNEPEIQRIVTRACILCARLMHQHGAESAVTEQLSTRLGLCLGMDSIELSISSDAIILTTIYQKHCLTTVRKSVDAGINMHILSEVHRVVKEAEEGKIPPLEVQNALKSIEYRRHPNWLVVLMTGAACASFSVVAGASWKSALVTLLVASLAMFIRQRLAIIKTHPMVNVCITAFVATLLATLITSAAKVESPEIAIASCILLLTPGVPLINSVSDIFRGYVGTGIARGVIATALILSTSIGVVLAMSFLGVSQW